VLRCSACTGTCAQTYVHACTQLVQSNSSSLGPVHTTNYRNEACQLVSIGTPLILASVCSCLMVIKKAVITGKVKRTARTSTGARIRQELQNH
jgi:hypothetical protein